MKEIILKVEGMRCGMCEAHINDTVRKIAKIKKVSSSHKKNETIIISDDDIDEKLFIDSITSLGYKILSFDIRPYQKKGLFK